MNKFGELLRFYRRQSTDSERGGMLTQKLLGELLKTGVGITVGMTGATISNWEKGKHSINKDDRTVLVALIKVLNEFDGIKSPDEANKLLKAGNYRVLDDDEILQINPDWLSGQTELAPSFSEGDGEKSKFIFTAQSSTSIPIGIQKLEAPPFLTPHLPLPGIIGRDETLNNIRQLLAWGEEEALEIPPVALRGMGGIGKTTLATAIGRLENVRDRFPDGVLWAALGPTPTIRFLQDGWGRALGVDLLPARDEDACRERLQSILYHRCVLLIIDDVWDVNHGKYFTVAGPKCRTLITTRESPVAHDLATSERTLQINVLSPDAALTLLEKLAPQAAADEKNAHRLCERLENLPLAITLAGRYLATEADVPSRMKRLVDELIDRREARLQLLQSEGRLGIEENEPVSLQAILGLSVDRLNKTNQERFAMLSVFGAEPLKWDLDAVAYVWECTKRQAEDTVSEFSKRGLVEYRENDNYWTHALLADYAGEMLKEMGL